jgi:hypothetical protein
MSLAFQPGSEGAYRSRRSRLRSPAPNDMLETIVEPGRQMPARPKWSRARRSPSPIEAASLSFRSAKIYGSG